MKFWNKHCQPAAMHNKIYNHHQICIKISRTTFNPEKILFGMSPPACSNLHLLTSLPFIQ